MYECKEANKINKSRGFLKGVDISSILELMDKGAAFFDNKGRNRRVFDILKENNINSVRLRISSICSGGRRILRSAAYA